MRVRDVLCLHLVLELPLSHTTGLHSLFGCAGSPPVCNMPWLICDRMALFSTENPVELNLTFPARRSLQPPSSVTLSL